MTSRTSRTSRTLYQISSRARTLVGKEGKAREVREVSEGTETPTKLSTNFDPLALAGAHAGGARVSLAARRTQQVLWNQRVPLEVKKS